MSATVGDSEDLSRRLGTKQIVKIPVPAVFSERTMGRRLIVMNRTEDQDFPARLEATFLAALRILPKSVWLCSSKEEARKFEQKVSEMLNLNGFVGHPTWILQPEGDEIDAFKQAQQGHLFVAGRFDGMDFQADECRIVVITTLPRAVNLQENFITTYLRDAGFMKRRLNQRIVQALGRCNRSEEDFGVYILADMRFVSHFGLEANKKGIPQNIVAEIDMAQDMAEVGVEQLIEQVEQFMQGDFHQYDLSLQDYLSDLPLLPVLPPSSIPESSVEQSITEQDITEKEVLGWTCLFDSQYYAQASHSFDFCWEATRQTDRREIAAFYAWCRAKAIYLQSLQNDPAAGEKALLVLEEAISHGGRSAWFNRMRASLNRARNAAELTEQIQQNTYAESLLQHFDELLENLGSKGNKFERWCNRITSLLSSERHNEYQEGLEKLGDLLGYRASRTQYEAATDCRWRGIFGNHREVITFEAKIEHNASQSITPSDMGQAHNQLARAEEEFQKYGYSIRGTIVTHLTTLAPSVSSSSRGIKIIEKAALLSLWEHIHQLLSTYRENWSLENIATRSGAAQRVRSRIPEAGWLIRVIDHENIFIDAEQITKEWQ
jgi:hypothetical protein